VHKLKKLLAASERKKQQLRSDTLLARADVSNLHLRNEVL